MSEDECVDELESVTLASPFENVVNWMILEYGISLLLVLLSHGGGPLDRRAHSYATPLPLHPMLYETHDPL